MNPEMSVEGQLVDNVLRGLEDEFSQRISHANIFDRVSGFGVMGQANVQAQRESIKRDILNALSVSNQTQRLYFIVRSMMMSILGAIITLVIFWQLGTINLIEDLVLGISTYVVCLAVSRLFDKKIFDISERIITLLQEHTKLRDFIVKNF